MLADSRERRIAGHLHGLVDDFIAPFLARLISGPTIMDPAETLLTKREAARQLDKTVKTIDRWIRAGKLQAKGDLVSRRDIDRLKLENGED